MVEQRKRPNRAVSLQAGPGEVDPEGGADVNLRVSSTASRVLGRQLALMGDQFDRQWTSGRMNRLPTPLHLLRPLLRDVHHQLWGLQGPSAAVRGSASTAWLSRWKPVSRAGWTKGLLVTLALVATATVVGGLWAEPKA